MSNTEALAGILSSIRRRKTALRRSGAATPKAATRLDFTSPTPPSSAAPADPGTPSGRLPPPSPRVDDSYRFTYLADQLGRLRAELAMTKEEAHQLRATANAPCDGSCRAEEVATLQQQLRAARAAVNRLRTRVLGLERDNEALHDTAAHMRSGSDDDGDDLAALAAQLVAAHAPAAVTTADAATSPAAHPLRVADVATSPILQPVGVTTSTSPPPPLATATCSTSPMPPAPTTDASTSPPPQPSPTPPPPPCAAHVVGTALPTVQEDDADDWCATLSERLARMQTQGGDGGRRHSSVHRRRSSVRDSIGTVYLSPVRSPDGRSCHTPWGCPPAVGAAFGTPASGPPSSPGGSGGDDVATSTASAPPVKVALRVATDARHNAARAPAAPTAATVASSKRRRATSQARRAAAAAKTPTCPSPHAVMRAATVGCTTETPSFSAIGSGASILDNLDEPVLRDMMQAYWAMKPGGDNVLQPPVSMVAQAATSPVFLSPKAVAKAGKPPVVPTPTPKPAATDSPHSGDVSASALQPTTVHNVTAAAPTSARKAHRQKKRTKGRGTAGKQQRGKGSRRTASNSRSKCAAVTAL